MGTNPLTKDNNISTGKGLLIISIIFVAFNLRPALTSVGPLISSIRSDLEISNGIAGFLTTLPLLAFAFFSFLAPRLGHRYGNGRIILFGLLVLSIGILIRSSGFTSLLFLGTALIGVGIAIGNVLLPGIIKQKYPDKVGLMTGVYTTSMGIGAAVGAGLSVPIARGLGGWDKSLAIWAVFSIIALIFWLTQLIKENNAAAKVAVNKPSASLWKSSLAWQVTIFMGFQSLLYYCLITWLPEILTFQGLTIATAGWLLSFMQLTGIPANFITPVLADRFPDQRKIVAGIAIISITGLTGLLFLDNIILLTICIAFIGLAQGAYISLALTFIGLRAANAKQASSLSGMAQSVGYLLAAVGPITIGFLFDLFQTWVPALIIFIVISFIILLTGIGAGQNKTLPE